MLRLIAGTAALFILAMTGTIYGDDAGKTKLEKAKVLYKTQLEKLRGDVATKLEERETAARKKGDNKLVSKLADEKVLFEKDNIIPTTFSSLSFQKQLNQMRLTLETAYKVAIKELTINKMDIEAKAVQKELDEFQESFDAI